MSGIASLAELRERLADLPEGDDAAAAAIAERQSRLTKPQGSLGRLEELAAWLGRWQGREAPRLDDVSVLVFAGNHGVVARGVSAYPASVTAQMVANFEAGGAAINQICKSVGAQLARDPAEARCTHRRFHGRAGHERGGIRGGCGGRLRCGAGKRRSRLPRRDGHRQHHRCLGACRGAARRRRRALGRARHRPRRCRLWRESARSSTQASPGIRPITQTRSPRA